MTAIRLVIFFSLGTIAQAFDCDCFSQSNKNQVIWKALIAIEKEDSISYEQRLSKVLDLKKTFDSSRLQEDSVYARLLHRIAFYEYKMNDDIPTYNSILLTLRAVRINSSGKKDCSSSYSLNSYTNLGIYYKALRMYDAALKYFDSALTVSQRFPSPQISKVILLLEKSQMHYKLGDYQKAIEEDDIAIAEAQNSEEKIRIPSLLNQRALSYLTQKNAELALSDVIKASALSQQYEDNWEAANSMIIKAEILSQKKEFPAVLKLYREAVQLRTTTDNKNRLSQIADDYTNLGNIYLNALANVAEAKKCYLRTIRYAEKEDDFERLSKGHINLAIAFFRQGDYEKAEQYCVLALRDFKMIPPCDFLANPPAAQLNLIGNKELVSVILENKTEFLLRRFKLSGARIYLEACLRTALLTDTVITNIRHQQSGEQSKLYWRNWTREFFTYAIEASYLAQNASHAFYFMEKSRAVLLNDKLNELGASNYLPAEEQRKEQELKIMIISGQQRLTTLLPGTPEYQAHQVALTQVQQRFEHYIKSLEEKYPAYFQYKYADKIISIGTLQQYLHVHDQSFVHYFINDTLAYVLVTTPGESRIFKLPKHGNNFEQIAAFNHFCSNKNLLVDDYSSFASLSHSLYSSLFQPLQIAKGRVIISPDNFIIPFEALSVDTSGNRLLLNDYSFSYVYSARYLFNNIKPTAARGVFIGFAPVSFEHHLQVPDLLQSAQSMKTTADFYHYRKLFLNKQASKKNFINNVADYSVVNIFSHAVGDTAEIEPMLYMQDSVIRLSELQVLGPRATNLVVLSACETSVGKNASGEGVYSLARGFASVGIPSIAATLWKADEQSIYEMSEHFHRYISAGMCKDSALQRAKLDLINANTSTEKTLPFYWASMILIGNAEPINLSAEPEQRGWVAVLIILVLIIVLLIILQRKPLVVIKKE